MSNPEPKRTAKRGQFPSAAVEPAHKGGVLVKYRPTEAGTDHSIWLDGETAKRLIRPEMLPDNKGEDFAKA